MIELRSGLIALLCMMVSTQLSAQCEALVRAEDNGILNPLGKARGPAIISGDAVSIPQLRLRFADAKNGERVTPNTVTVTYSWKWLEYPYPEHVWGAWSDAYDFLTCSIRKSDEDLIIPEYMATPRGWYDGKYTKFPWSRKPKFEGVGIKVEQAQCASRFGIRKAELSMYEKIILTVQLSCSAAPKLILTKP